MAEVVADGREDLVGRTLGEFVVRERLGEGGFGAVYRAEQPLLAREAVVKVQHGHHRNDPDLIQRFLREARLASRLDHPYAAHVYAFGAEPDGLLWIAMELVRGTPLSEMLEVGGALAAERLVPLVDRICEVVYSAHEQGIVHRDLKPANVMVMARAGRLLPKLLDFGIAKVVGEAAEALPALTPPRIAANVVVASGYESTQILGQKQAGKKRAPAPKLDSVDSSNITRAGELMGSPAYMAPELWTHSSLAGPRSDIYALGVLCFEALTLKLPFTARTINELALRHARDELPHGDGVPGAVMAVLRKATAKRAEDRHATALELAAELRAALGEPPVEAPIPRLDDAVRDLAVAEAPHPIAEAVLILDRARHPHQARAAAAGVARTILHYAGVLALAARTRTAGRDAPPSEHLRELRRRPLSEREWAAMIGELVSPFARIRDAFPLPELVGWVETGLGELTAFIEAHGAAGADSLDDQVRALRTGLPVLARLLGDVRFLSEYTLAVVRPGGAERWMGGRGGGELVALRGEAARALPVDSAILVDGAGTPVLALAPLAQVAEPAPGVPEELFLFTGPSPRGAGRLTALPRDFERHDDAVWNALRGLLAATADGDTEPSAVEETPYRGLSSFGAGDAALFFGREREVEAFVNKLQVQPIMAVVGPSGAGKSSFVHAGVVPALASRWRTLGFRPGAAPLRALAACLARAGLRPEDLAASRERILLVVDQLEELFTLGAPPAEQAAFAAALVAAAGQPEAQVRVVVTLRDDFLVRAETLAPFRGLLAAGLQLLGTPARGDLLRILGEPARRAGYVFDDASLPDRIVDSVTHEPGALALLSFCAARLFELRDRHFKQLLGSAYDAMGGVGGALARHAEDTLAGLTAPERRLVRDAFRHLVTAQGTRAVLARSALRDVLGGGDGADVVVERLIAARLLVVSEGERGEEKIEIIHEALLTAWPELLAWRREDAEGARLRDQLRQAAAQWRERGRARGRLWRPEALAEYRVWRARRPEPLPALEEEFAAASLADEARGRRLRRVALAGAFTALAAGAGVFYVQNQETARQSALAVQHLRDLYAEQGRLAVLRGDVGAGIVYLREAMRLGERGIGLRTLVAHAERPLRALRRTLRGHTGAIEEIAVTADGVRAVSVSLDGTARVWDLASGRSLLTLTAGAPLVGVSMSPDGARVLTRARDGALALWDGRTGQLLLRPRGNRWGVLSPDGGRIAAVDGDAAVVTDAATGAALLELAAGERLHKVVFAPDGRRLVTVSPTTLRLWDASDGRPLVAADAGLVADLGFSPDGKTLFTQDILRTAALWDAATLAPVTTVAARNADSFLDGSCNHAFAPGGGNLVYACGERAPTRWHVGLRKAVLTFEGHGAPVTSMTFDPEGARVLTASNDGTARIWDLERGQARAVLVGHLDSVRDARFLPGGEVLTASRDGTLKVWSGATQGLEAAFVGQRGAIWGIATLGDDRLVTVGQDHRVRLWDSRTGGATGTFDGEPGAGDGVAISPDGRRIALANQEGASVWELAGGARVASLRGHASAVYRVAFSPDGTRLATASDDHTARLWDLAGGGRELRRFEHPRDVNCAAFDPTGRLLVTAGEDRVAVVWDAASGERRRVYGGHAAGVVRALFSPDGRRLMTAGRDHSVRLWDTATGGETASLSVDSEIVDAAWSPDGTRVAATGPDRVAHVWEAATGKAALELPLGDTGTSIAFASDGRSLFVGTYHTLQRWSVAPYEGSDADLDRLIDCGAPFVLQGGVLVGRSATCASDLLPK